ncbi:MAG: hypothetical protein M3Y41_17380 [Pseudomonadota bacterium]|nr:hypothetical protein [Pseudomonadota bacterium]
MIPRLLRRVALCGVLLPTAAGAQTVADVELNPVPQPPIPSLLRPVERVPRAAFGVVGPFPLTQKDLAALVYPSASADERAAVLEGLTFFTTPHTEPEGAGPIANQPMCLGCHLSSADALKQDERGNRLVTSVSPVSRAARSTPTNFDFVGFDPATGGGQPADNLDAITNTGLTAAFTVFGDFSPSTKTFDGLTQFSSNSTQHTRPTLPDCLPDPLPPFDQDPNLAGGTDPATHLSATGFRRTTGERAGPPYIGRGLMEAVADQDILTLEAAEAQPSTSSLDISGLFPECTSDCVAGRHNENTSNQAFVGGDPNERVGRLGLRAAGPTLMQFVMGGLQGELGFTSVLNPNEPTSLVNADRPGCVNTVPTPEVPLSTPISLRALMRLTAPPEFGPALLNVLYSPDPSQPPIGAQERKVWRGAQLFGIDLTAFANRMISGRFPPGGDGLDPNAINQTDRMLNCAGCHTPVVATGRLPDDSGTQHINNVWAPLFSDLLIHPGPSINAERNAPTQRLPLLLQRVDDSGAVVPTYDIQRGLTDDTLPNQGIATGRDFRTPPLMGLGRMGPPFMHDGRVFLSNKSVLATPAGTVTSNSAVTNAPLVVRTLDEAILAAIELHDLPAPFDAPGQATATGGGCPVPPGNQQGDIVYPNGAADICPSYGSPTSGLNRSDSRAAIARFHNLSREDQQALIEFLKEL